MSKRLATFYFLFAAIAFIAAGCDSRENVPFSEKDVAATTPEISQLQLTAEKNLSFDTAAKNGVVPVVKKLDMDALPSQVYDSSGFKPFSKLPEKTTFNFASLPDTLFEMKSLPSGTLKWKTNLLPVSVNVKAQQPAIVKGMALLMYEMGARQNLPALFITSSFIDRYGVLWVGSREGIFRYDGEHVQTIIPGPIAFPPIGMTEDRQGRIWYADENSLKLLDLRKGTLSVSTQFGLGPAQLSKLFMDAEGRIWIPKTLARKSVLIDPQTMAFQTMDRSNGIHGIRPADIVIDNENRIWVSGAGAGINIIDPASGKIKYLSHANGLSNDTNRTITKDNEGQIWVANNAGGVDAINVAEGSITHYSSLQGMGRSFGTCLGVDGKGQIWIGRGVDAGVDILNPAEGRSRHLGRAQGFGGNYITDFVRTTKDEMWVAGITGLRLIAEHGATTYPLGNIQVISLLEDTIGNIWVATSSGVRIIDPKRTTVRILDEAHGLANNFVQSFSQFEQRIWVTSNGGLDIIDPVKKTLEHIGQKEGLGKDTVYVGLKDRLGNTWFTGPSNGVDIIDSSMKSILHLEKKGGLCDNTVVDMKEDHEGLVWLAGNTGGVSIIDFQRHTIRQLNNMPGLRDTCFKTMLVDEHGRVWIATDKGIYVVDKKTGSITTVTAANGLSSNRVLSLLPYKGNIISGNLGKINLLTPPAGAPETTGKDSAANKWKIATMANSEGLFRANPNTWAADGITRDGKYLWGDDGLTIINEIQARKENATTIITGISVLNKPQSFIDFGSSGASDSVWMDDKLYPTRKIPAASGYADRETIKFDSLEGAFNVPVSLVLPYEDNYMQFHFAQTKLERQEATQYCYILEGIDKNWSPVTTNPYSENYLNLPPGSYQFKVSSKDINGNWGKPAIFSFTISPPWYKTWWAYLLYVLVGAAILRAYILYRSKRLQRENKLLEEKVALRTSQLQKSLEDLKSTQSQLIQSEKMASLGELTAGIAHEIQNPLNFINNFSEVNGELIADLKEEIAHGNFEEVKNIADNIAVNEDKINHHGRRADSIVKGMLQHSRSGSGQKESANINAIADEYFRLAYHGLRAKDKSFNAAMISDLDERLAGKDTGLRVVPQDIGRVVLNLITNAFYAVNEKRLAQAKMMAGQQDLPKAYEPTVWVSTRKSGNKALVSVRDNGNGIPHRMLDKIFQPFFTTKPAGQGTGLGLSLSYDIVKAHGGELIVETKEGEGTTFTIQLPMTGQ